MDRNKSSITSNDLRSNSWVVTLLQKLESTTTLCEFCHTLPNAFDKMSACLAASAEEAEWRCHQNFHHVHGALQTACPQLSNSLKKHSCEHFQSRIFLCTGCGREQLARVLLGPSKSLVLTLERTHIPPHGVCRLSGTKCIYPSPTQFKICLIRKPTPQLICLVRGGAKPFCLCL